MASLEKQALSSVKWTTLQTAVVGITGPILLIIKARFLTPAEFGYIAILLIVIDFFRLMEGFGISQAIIQKDKVSVKEASTLFYFNILLSLSLAALLYIAAPLFASFFSLPVLEEYLPLVCVIVMVTGPVLLFQAYLEKNLYFKYLSLINISRNLVVLVSTTILLVSGMGVPGVIYAQIIGTAFAAVFILVATIRYKTVSVSLYFNPVTLGPFLRFGIFVSAKQLLTFTTHRLDELLIGYLLSSEILGVYYFGKNLLERIRSLMTMSFGKVLFPVFSKVKHQPQKLSFVYRRISRYIAFGAFPVFSGIAATAHLFVPVIFGEQWIASVIVFQVFSIVVIFWVLTANVSTSLLYSVGKPAAVFYIDIATTVIYFTSLFFFAGYGLLAVLIAYSFYVAYKTMTLQYYANRQLVNDFLSYFHELTMPAFSAMVMVAAVLLFQVISGSLLGQMLQLVGSIIIGALVYALMSRVFLQETLDQLRADFISREGAG